MTALSMYRNFPKTILLLCVLSLAGCDQVTKGIARHTLTAGESIPLIGGVIHLRYAENPGTFLSMGAQLDAKWRWSLYIVSTIVVLISMVLLLMHAHRLGLWGTIGLLLLLSGAVGNLVDRFLNHGRVIDFMILGLGDVHTGIFNGADVFITVGVVLFLVAYRPVGRRAT
jgi:signal peptidase II